MKRLQYDEKTILPRLSDKGKGVSGDVSRGALNLGKSGRSGEVS